MRPRIPAFLGALALVVLRLVAVNESYNGTLAPDASVTVGFIGTYTNSDASPTAVTCDT
jgi:hypothetical protein